MKYSASWYLTLLSEGQNVEKLVLQSEKDIPRALASIVQGLSKAEDWEARISALIALQGVGLGVNGNAGLAECLASCLRGQICELVCCIAKLFHYKLFM